jgi:hypothetical protein
VGVLVASSILFKAIKALMGPLVTWMEKRTQIKEAELDVKLKTIMAKGELAAHIVKSELEWDLTWAKGAQDSWKDEFLLILWAAPLIMLFIPYLAPYADVGFTNLARYHPDAPKMYMAGWAVIFSAVWGTKAAMRAMAPGRIPELIDKMGQVEDDIPDDVVTKVHEKIKQKFSSSKKKTGDYINE